VKAKRKGTRNEHRTMEMLEAAGYSCTRAAGRLGLFAGSPRTSFEIVSTDFSVPVGETDTAQKYKRLTSQRMRTSPCE
jgi:hypothetical protein